MYNYNGVTIDIFKMQILNLTAMLFDDIETCSTWFHCTKYGLDKQLEKNKHRFTTHFALQKS